jgi:hypothetical protein
VCMRHAQACTQLTPTASLLIKSLGTVGSTCLMSDAKGCTASDVPITISRSHLGKSDSTFS